ncbi:exocyst complex component exo70 [Thecaphora frezii]
MPASTYSFNASSASRYQSSSQQDTELAFAELQLLSQNQRKLASLTTRMTTILTGFDKRLIRLEGSILPIHKSTQKLARMSDNIDLTLAALNKTLGHYDVLIDEQPIIKAGPDVRDTEPYMQTIDRVLKGLAYLERSDLKGQDGVVKRMNDLVETGARNLVDVVRDWVNADSEPIDLTEFSPRNVSYPVLSSPTQEAIVPIFRYLADLPDHPRTRYSPLPAALSTFATVRAAYLNQCLSPMVQRIYTYAVEKIGTGVSSAGMVMVTNDDDDDAGGSYRRGESNPTGTIGAYCAMLENDHRILQSLLSDAGLQKEALLSIATFSHLATTPLRTLVENLSSVYSHVRRHISTHTFFLFDVIGGLSTAILSGRWDGLIRQMEDPSGGMLRSAYIINKSDLDIAAGLAAANEVLDIYNKFKNLAMGIFPRFIEDIKGIPQRRAAEVPSTSVNEITHMALQFIRQIAEYSDVVGPLLQTLGPGNWMMSSNAAPVLSLGLDDDPSKRTIVGEYLNDVLTVVLGALEQRSKAIRQPSTASIFLLNNIGHLKRFLKAPLPAYFGEDEGEGAPPASILSLHLGQVGEDLLTSATRQANTAYLDAWGPVVATLMEDQPITGPNSQYHRHATTKLMGVGGGSEKNQVKDRFAKFYEGLDDLERLHRAYPFSREDGELKERLKRDVERMVCPLYGKFMAKHRASDFTKNPSKHIRMTEVEVEDKIRRMFE